MTVRAYCRVSTVDQARNGFGMHAQRSAITAEAAAKGWLEVEWYEDGGQSGKDLERPAMRRLLADLRRGDQLVVAKLDRLSRSLTDFAALMELAQRQRWNVVALDMAIDLSTPQGEFMASVLAAMARWERRIIGQRTAEGMAAARARGRLPGRRSSLPREIQDRIVQARDRGSSLRAVAETLNKCDVSTPSGGSCWTGSTVWAAERSARLEREAERIRA